MDRLTDQMTNSLNLCCLRCSKACNPTYQCAAKPVTNRQRNPADSKQQPLPNMWSETVSPVKDTPDYDFSGKNEQPAPGQTARVTHHV